VLNTAFADWKSTQSENITTLATGDSCDVDGNC